MSSRVACSIPSLALNGDHDVAVRAAAVVRVFDGQQVLFVFVGEDVSFDKRNLVALGGIERADGSVNPLIGQRHRGLDGEIFHHVDAVFQGDAEHRHHSRRVVANLGDMIGVGAGNAEILGEVILERGLGSRIVQERLQVLPDCGNGRVVEVEEATDDRTQIEAGARAGPDDRVFQGIEDLDR